MTKASHTRLLDRRTRRRLGMALAAAALLVLLAGLVSAQSSPNYDLSWYTFDNGNGSQTGFDYELAGTLGESLAGWAGSGSYEIRGGFDPVVRFFDRDYLPIILRGHP